MNNNQPNPRRVNYDSEDSNSEENMAASAEVDEMANEIVFHDDVGEIPKEDAFELQRQRSEKFLTNIRKAEEDAIRRQVELPKKFAELRRQKEEEELQAQLRQAEEELQVQRHRDLDLLIGSFQTDIDEGRLTEALVQSTFMSYDYDCNVAHMLLSEMLKMERQAVQGEHQIVIDRLYGMREGLGRPDMTKEQCQELLEANDWDLTKTIVSIS